MPDDGQLSGERIIRRTRSFKYLLAGGVSLITFLVYLSCLRNEFVNWDDNVYVYENPYIRSFGPNLFKWAFLNFYASNWHPLTWISHALDYAVWGLNPFGHHLTNNILHSINTFIVVLLVVRLVEIASLRNSPHPPLRPRGGAEGGGVIQPMESNSRFTLIAAATTGLLFGLHPLHVESVAWVSERKDLLCALFYLLSIMAYTSYLKRGWRSRGRYILALCCFILALMSKPMAVSLPFILLILDWYPFNRIQSIRSFRSAFIGKLPFILLSLGSSVLTILAQREGGALNMRRMEIVPLATRVLVAAKSLIAYLEKMILPIKLSPYYPYPKNISLFSLEYLSAIVLLAGITAACVAMAKKQKLWLAVWACYVITLVPVIGLVQVGGQSMADRYAYLPSLGPFFIAGLGMAWVSMIGHSVRKKWGQTVKFATAAAAILLFASTAYLTVNQIRIWKNSFALWTYVIETRPHEIPLAYYNRGLIYIEKRRLDKAKEDLDNAIALNPYYREAYFNRGIVLGNMGQLDKAIADFTAAISLNQTDADAFLNRGLLLLQIGQTESAATDFRNACGLGSDFGWPCLSGRATS